MGDIVQFKSPNEIRIEYMYAPEINQEHPFALRIVCDRPEDGIWLSRSEYIELIAGLVDAMQEEC